MKALADAIEGIAAETRFSGVVRIDVGTDVMLASAYGLANRACGAANMVESQFTIASGVKGITALTVVSLIDEGGSPWIRRLDPCCAETFR